MRKVFDTVLVWNDMPDKPMLATVCIDPNWIERNDWQGWDEDDEQIAYYFLSQEEFDMAKLPNNGFDFRIVNEGENNA